MRNENGQPTKDTPPAAKAATAPRDPEIWDKPGALVDALDGFRDAIRSGGEEHQQAAAPPAPPVEAEIRAIAERIRRWREEGDLTLQELARRSSVAASTIQKVETQQMVPTVGVLLKIAWGLGRAASDLMHESAEDLHAVHLPARARHPVGVTSRMTIERLVGDLFEACLESWRVTLQPGAGSGRERVRWEGEALIQCEEGEITFWIGEEEYPLRAGDILHYKTTIAHGWRNVSQAPARMQITTTLSRGLRKLLHHNLREEGTVTPETASAD